MKLRYIALAACMLLSVKAYSALEEDYMARLNDAIDHREADEVERLAKIVTVSPEQKARLIESATKRVAQFEAQTLSTGVGGNFLRILGSTGITAAGIGGALVSGQKLLNDGNNSKQKLVATGTILASGAVAGLGAFLTAKELGSDAFKIGAGSSLTLAGLGGILTGAYFGWFDEENKYPEDHFKRVCKTGISLSAGLGALGIWLIKRGIQRSYVYGHLSKARRILATIEKLPVSRA
jgi:hypothetical protein